MILEVFDPVKSPGRISLTCDDKRDSMVHEDCLELKGRAFHFGESSNDGDKAILCGSTVRLFDCKKQRCIQTISRMSNAETALAHDQKKMCLVDASRKGVTAAEFADENGLWVEKNRSLIKAINTDGGRPCFSSDDRYFFFTTDFCRLWRYTLGTGICECIWEKGFPDQLMQFDLYEDQILIISGSSEKPDHCGFDILDINGNVIKTLRYHGREETVTAGLPRSVWMNRDEIFTVHAKSVKHSYDLIQTVDWKKTGVLRTDPEGMKLERPSGYLYDFCISPDRRYLVFVWRNWQRKDMVFDIAIFTAGDMKKIYRSEVDRYISMTHSVNSRYLLICSVGSCLRIDMGQA